jgi:hypothetical protein
MAQPTASDTITGAILGLTKKQVRKLGGTMKLYSMSPEALRLLVNRVKTNSDNRGSGGKKR